jgi:F-type H+-transporting ATPase subunit b
MIAGSTLIGIVFLTIGGRGPVYDLIMRIVNFTVLLGVLIYFVRKPAVEGMRSSIESLRKMLSDAEETSKQAEARMKETEDRLAKVDEETEALVTAAHKESEIEKERILAEAEEVVQRLKGEARVYIEQELKKAQNMLREEVAGSAMDIAEQIIRKNIKQEDQRRFIIEYLEKLEAS